MSQDSFEICLLFSQAGGLKILSLAGCERWRDISENIICISSITDNIEIEVKEKGLYYLVVSENHNQVKKLAVRIE